MWANDVTAPWSLSLLLLRHGDDEVECEMLHVPVTGFSCIWLYSFIKCKHKRLEEHEVMEGLIDGFENPALSRAQTL